MSPGLAAFPALLGGDPGASSPRSSGTRSSAPRRSSGRARRRCWPTPGRPAAASSTTSPPRPTPWRWSRRAASSSSPGAAARRGACAPRPLRRLRARSRKRSPARPPPRGHPLERASAPARRRGIAARVVDAWVIRVGPAVKGTLAAGICLSCMGSGLALQRHPTPARRPGASAAKGHHRRRPGGDCPTVVPAGRATAPSAAPLCSRSAANWRAADAPQPEAASRLWRIERGLPCSGEQARPAGARREASSGGREYARVLSVARHALRRRGHHDVPRARGRGDRPRAFAPRASSPTTA